MSLTTFPAKHDHNLGTAKQIIANIEIEDKMIVQNFKNIWPRESEIRAWKPQTGLF